MRIVSLAPSNTEILFRLGSGDQIVATTSLSDYPEEAVSKPGLGGWNEGVDLEAVEEKNPDIIFTSDDLQDGITEKLRDRGLNVVQVKPHTLEEVYSSILTIGKEIGREKRAEKIIEEMRTGLQQVSISGERIYCEEWMDPPHVSGNWVPGLIEEIGGEYFTEEGERSREFRSEKLKGFDPEYIFLNVCGAGKNVDRSKIIERKGWKDMTAVDNKDVYIIEDELLNRSGPRLAEGARRIAEKFKGSEN